MLHPLTWFRSLLTAVALCAVAVAWAPQASAEGPSTSCTLRSPLDLFSKPKGQGRRTHLNTGAVLEVLSHNGNWYTVYTGSAEAYVAASAFSRACTTAPRPTAPQHKTAADLIELPLEPVPTSPAPPPSPPPLAPATPEVADPGLPPVVLPPAPPMAQEIVPPPPTRSEVPPPVSYFEPPAPILERQVSSRAVWVGVETGLWVGGGVAVVASAVLYTVNALRASDAARDINAYVADCDKFNCNGTSTTASDADHKRLSSEFDTANSEASTVHTLNTLTIITGVAGVAALGAALGLHYWGPQALDGSDPNPMAMPTLRIGWGTLVLEGKF